jgi:hypothetical protein
MIKIRISNDVRDAASVFPVIRDLEESYPAFPRWWWNTVIPGIRNGEDRIILAESLKGDIAGISVVKKSDRENKIRALRVTRPYAGQSLAGHLFESSFRYLDDEYPVCSVADPMLKTLAPFMINRYGFKITEVHKGQYKQGVEEYWFNTNHQKRPQKLLPLGRIVAREPR